MAVLPGQVVAVYPHPDRLGIDYITGETDQPSASMVYHQRYTLRFGDPSPRLLVGQFERSAYDFGWSFDGRFLAYTITNDQPGSSSQRFIRLVDLDCRTSGECTPFTADTGSQDVYHLTWSPVDYRIALGGAPIDQNYGTGDIFLLNLDPATYQTTLTNLTQSPMVDDWAPARWTPSGDGLLFACSTGQEASINDYSLCHSNLSAGSDKVTSAHLPWNMHSIDLAGGRWLVDSMPVMDNGVYSLRTYDLQTGQAGTLLQWPASAKYLVESRVSPDGQWAAAFIADQGGLLALNVQTHESNLVMPSQTTPAFIGWVK